MPSTSLESKIYQLSLNKQNDLPVNDQEESLSNSSYESFADECEIIEEMSEMELLEHLDALEDPLSVCQRLFTKVPEPFHGFIYDLYHQGLVIVDDFIDESNRKTILDEAQVLLDNGVLKDSRSHGPEVDPFRDHAARRDVMTWLEADQCSPGLGEILRKLEKFKAQLNMFISLASAEHQLACYPGHGAYYERHRDALPNDDLENREQRRITAILYLNKSNDWNESDGGYLRIHRLGSEQDIKPQGGRLLLFLSGVIDHEVLPAYRSRMALTTWFS